MFVSSLVNEYTHQPCHEKKPIDGVFAVPKEIKICTKPVIFSPNPVFSDPVPYVRRAFIAAAAGVPPKPVRLVSLGGAGALSRNLALEPESLRASDLLTLHSEELDL
jgi:hypothetical protein